MHRVGVDHARRDEADADERRAEEQADDGRREAVPRGGDLLACGRRREIERGRRRHPPPSGGNSDDLVAGLEHPVARGVHAVDEDDPRDAAGEAETLDDRAYRGGLGRQKRVLRAAFGGLRLEAGEEPRRDRVGRGRHARTVPLMASAAKPGAPDGSTPAANLPIGVDRAGL